jgi:hypothetical protein
MFLISVHFQNPRLYSLDFINISAKMRCSYALQVILVVAGVGNAQFAGGTYTAVVGGPDTNASLFGNYYN